jgi:hypothetical protein
MAAGMMMERRVAVMGDGALQYLIFVSGVSSGDTAFLVMSMAIGLT